MKRSTRPLTGLLAGATAVAVLLPPATAVAQEPTPTEAAAAWLVDQLVDGDHLSGEFGPQYGPTADVALALLTTGEQPAVLGEVLDYLTSPEVVDAYVHGGEFDGTTVEDPTYVGANAKLGFLVTVAGLDPRAVGGDDLVEGMLSLEDDETGAFEDRSDFGNFANVLSQSFAIMFLDEAEGVDPSTASVQYLVDAQCDDGGFPQDFGTPTCESSVDATGLALQALVAVDAPNAVRADAASYLVEQRGADGAWGDPPNVNTTAYAGMGLRAQDRGVAETRAFLREVQNADGGLPVIPGDDSDPYATAQALPLLAGTTLVADAPTTVGRVAGENRRLTAIEASQVDFADDAASTVVLARDDVFADALAGTPLAVAGDGPLLITPPTGLTDEVLAEIERVLPEGGEVLVLGGRRALPASVVADLREAGFEPRRIFGTTRYETSVAIAEELGDPDLRLLTTGLVFPDALTAGTAAATVGGAVLLTEGEEPNATVSAYLAANAGEQIAVGGPAARAYPDAEALVGVDRQATAIEVAQRFFDTPTHVGVARLDLFPDALAGGAVLARRGGPLLLTAPTVLPEVTASYLCAAGDGLERATVFGGTAAVSADVVATIRDRATGAGC